MPSSWLRPKNFRKNRWVGLYLAVAGVAMLLGGIWFARDAALFLETTARAPGIVLELRHERGVRGLRKDHPIVRFTVRDTGREVVFRSRVGLWPSPFEAGEAVEVAYAPAEPEDAEIVSFWTIWLPSSALGLFGLMCAGAGALTLRAARRRKPRQRPPGG